MNFSTRLRILREKTNLTQKEFANLIKMPYTTYNGYEIGKREPDINQFVSILNHRCNKCCMTRIKISS